MEIVLLRHGKVNYPPVTWMSASEFISWVGYYNTNALDRACMPTIAAMNIAKKSKSTVCSELPRSIESAELLGISNINLSNSLFNEADLPIAPWRFPKMSIRIWAILFRFSWYLGYSNGSETVQDAKSRARKAAGILIDHAKEHQTVLFVGHGIFNRLIANELKSVGWRGPRSPGKNYWEFGVYTHKM